MLNEIKSFFKNNLLITLFSISLIISLTNIGSTLYLVKRLNSLVILHYNVYLGVDLMGSSEQIYLIPCVGFLFGLINLILAIYFFLKKERMLSHILSLSTLIIQLGVSVASGSLILVNYF
jgi:hypothetical protein